MIRNTLWILIALMAWNVASAQTAAEYEANYAKRIRLEVIDGVYIPADLPDAHSELTRLADPKALAQFRQSPEDSIRRKLHFGLGKWILINWGFEEGSRLSHYMKSKGVSVPDDMVEVIILTWHRHLNNKPLELAEEIAAIELRRAAEKAERDKKVTKTVIDRKPHKE
jgi:hypothetical protein